MMRRLSACIEGDRHGGKRLRGGIRGLPYNTGDRQKGGAGVTVTRLCTLRGKGCVMWA